MAETTLPLPPSLSLPLSLRPPHSLHPNPCQDFSSTKIYPHHSQVNHYSIPSPNSQHPLFKKSQITPLHPPKTSPCVFQPRITDLDSAILKQKKTFSKSTNLSTMSTRCPYSRSIMRSLAGFHVVRPLLRILQKKRLFKSNQLVSIDKFNSSEHRVVAKEEGPKTLGGVFFRRGGAVALKAIGLIEELLSEEKPPVYWTTSVQN